MSCADAYNVIRAGIGCVVGGVAIQMQTDAAGRSDTGVFRNGKVIDHTFASRKSTSMSRVTVRFSARRLPLFSCNSQRFQLHGRKADIASLQADDQPGEGVCRDGDGEHGFGGILGYLPVFRHFKGQGSTAIPAGGARTGECGKLSNWKVAYLSEVRDGSVTKVTEP